MPILDLLNQLTRERATDQNNSLVINMYLEEEQTTRLSQWPYSFMPDHPKGVYNVIMYSTFGLGVFCDTGKANVRAALEHNEVAYFVAGDTFYSIDSSGVKTSIGTLNTSSGFCKMAVIAGASDSNNQIVIIDGTNGYSYNVGTATLDFPIADANFPQTADDICSQDEICVVKDHNSISYNISNVGDTTTWQALNFASKEGQPDKIIAVASYMRELYLLGSKTCEIWQNIGNNLFSFQRRSDVFIEVGCAAKNSVVITANFLFFLGKGKHGGYAFLELESYQPKTISTKPVMAFLNTLTKVDDCVAIPFAMDGHEFIAWTFPTDNQTIVYDVATETWSLKQSYVNSVYGRWLGNCSCFCYGKNLIGDYNSGKIYSMSDSIYQENGVQLLRQFITPHVYKEGKYIYIHRLQIDVQCGGGGTFLLEMSNDRGRTWTSIETFTVPADTNTQLYTTSLGAEFSFTFRLSTTDNVSFILMGFQAEADVGDV